MSDQNIEHELRRIRREIEQTNQLLRHLISALQR